LEAGWIVPDCENLVSSLPLNFFIPKRLNTLMLTVVGAASSAAFNNDSLMLVGVEVQDATASSDET
jgi:hypothetical protein